MNNTKKTVIFDLDGTLVDTLIDIKNALDLSIKKYNFQGINDSNLRKMLGKGSKALIKKTFEVNDYIPSNEETEEILTNFLKYYKNNLCIHSQTFPGILETLDWLKLNNICIGICTNKYESLAKDLILKLKIDSYFNVITGGDTFNYRKPNPKHLIDTISLLGGIKENALMIGDSITDIQAARNAGIPSIAVSWGYTDIAPKDLGANKTITEGVELIPAIKSIFKNIIIK